MPEFRTLDQFIILKTIQRGLLSLYDTMTSFTYKTYKSSINIGISLVNIFQCNWFMRDVQVAYNSRHTSEANDALSVVLKSFKIALFSR